MITSEKVKTVQTKCFTFTEEMRSGLEAQPLQATLVNQGVEYDLIAQEVKSAEYRRSVMTVRLGHYFLFHLSIPLSYLLYYGHPPFAPCHCLELDLPPDIETGTRCLADCAPFPLSITRPIPTFAVPFMCASVPADVHSSCPLHAHISSPLPYVSPHFLCTPPDPLTYVTPRPLYALS